MLTEIPATAIDIYRMLPEGTRCEVIFNQLSMSPSPTSAHQLLLSYFMGKLFSVTKENTSGKVIAAPMDVYFEGTLSVVQPDVIVILPANEHIIKADGIYGAPDVIIEILSPYNSPHDLQKKKALYEKAGVPEYFIADPENKEVILFTLTSAGVYDITYQEKGLIRSALLSCVIDF